MPQFLKNIKSDMMKFPRDPNKYPRLQIRNLESKSAPGIKSVTYKTTVLGENDNYVTYVQFFKVDFAKAKDKDHPVATKVEKFVAYRENIDVNKHPVFLKCSCADFRFTWEYPLFKENALIGKYRKYVKVAGSNRGPRNPDERTGFCKHVYSLLSALKDSGQISG
jgi:hypothetical protein